VDFWHLAYVEFVEKALALVEILKESELVDSCVYEQIRRMRVYKMKEVSWIGCCERSELSSRD